MPFLGRSETQKEAQRFPREKGAWDFNQYKEWLNRQNRYGDQGDVLRGQAVDYWQGAGAEPVSIEQARRAGQEIMPGVDPAIAARIRRAQELQGGFDRLTPAGVSVADINAHRAGQAGDIARASDISSREIGDTATRMMGRSEQYGQDIMGGINRDYGNLKQQAQDVYGGLRADNAGTYADLRRGAEKSFAEMRAELEKTRPGGEFAAAQAARSFGPMAQAAAQRLRRAGVDPNSPEGAAAMSQVGEAKARAMDDRLASAGNAYYDRFSNLGMAKQGELSRLGENRLQGEVGLAGTQEGINRGLQLGQTGTIAGIKDAMRAEQQGIDLGRSQAQLGNIDIGTQRALGLKDAQIGDVVNARNMGREDLAIQAGLNQNLDEADLAGINLRGQQFGAGAGWEGMNQARRDQAMGQLMNISAQDYRNMLESGQMARGFGNDASHNYLQSYALEAPSASWGAKFLANLGLDLGLGVAAPGINKIPGMIWN